MADPLPPPELTGDRTMRFSSGEPIYRLADDAMLGDVYDHLTARLCQLTAMLRISRGENYDEFDRWPRDAKENYLRACEMIADECRELVERIPALHGG